MRSYNGLGSKKGPVVARVNTGVVGCVFEFYDLIVQAFPVGYMPEFLILWFFSVFFTNHAEFMVAECHALLLRV